MLGTSVIPRAHCSFPTSTAICSGKCNLLPSYEDVEGLQTFSHANFRRLEGAKRSRTLKHAHQLHMLSSAFAPLPSRSLVLVALTMCWTSTLGHSRFVGVACGAVASNRSASTQGATAFVHRLGAFAAGHDLWAPTRSTLEEARKRCGAAALLLTSCTLVER
jgi:hypothetical protein